MNSTFINNSYNIQSPKSFRSSKGQQSEKNINSSNRKECNINSLITTNYINNTRLPYQFAAYVTLLKNPFFNNLFKTPDNRFSGIHPNYSISTTLPDINDKNIREVWIWQDDLESIDFSDPNIINTMNNFVKYMSNCVNFDTYIKSLQTINDYNQIKGSINHYIDNNETNDNTITKKDASINIIDILVSIRGLTNPNDKTYIIYAKEILQLFQTNYDRIQFLLSKNKEQNFDLKGVLPPNSIAGGEHNKYSLSNTLKKYGLPKARTTLKNRNIFNSQNSFEKSSIHTFGGAKYPSLPEFMKYCNIRVDSRLNEDDLFEKNLKLNIDKK
jgi:hypothetical protein